jgi:predicted DCC family thiol-disulfide oxidoreductase YuxK
MTSTQVASGAPLLLLFDGECSFCNAAVLFIVDRDPNERFVFAPIASELGQRTLREHGLLDPSIDSLVLIENGRAYTHSDASLRVARHLSGGWPLAASLLIVPRSIRNALYRAFAKRRYLFGRETVCRVPTPALRKRFVG